MEGLFYICITLQVIIVTLVTSIPYDKIKHSNFKKNAAQNTKTC